ncbi:MAG: tripartite tricarboxylate transporter substrate-binding protein [Candidatus Moduliflexus flocculans]|nr:tripartite tricarboxylate transporter substrate-binding protein [Candidatus Moduliflexus flocculans]
MTSIPGSGSADALNAVLGGHVDCSGQLPSDVLPHIKANRLRVLAVALERRDPALPEVPTFRELGYNVVTAGPVKGVAFPKGTPKELVAYWDKKFKEVAEDAEFVEDPEGHRSARPVSAVRGIPRLGPGGLRSVRETDQGVRPRDAVA